ncbi:MAG: hypothetical protein ACRDOC_00670 [Streptosporangiaceae bacterium]
MARPEPGPWDADLSVLHTAVDNLGPWLFIWQARHEPDAHARRCASDAIDAIDTALHHLHSIRARLITETRQADDQAAARADELLARMRDGPPTSREPEDHHSRTSTSPRPEAPAAAIVGRGGDGGRAPRQVTP